MRCKLQPDIVLKRCKRKTYLQRVLHDPLRIDRWIEGPEMGKGTSKVRRRNRPPSPAVVSFKIGDVMGARGAQIPSIVVVAMVVILVLEKQADNEPRISSHSQRSLLLRGIPCTMWR